MRAEIRKTDGIEGIIQAYTPAGVDDTLQTKTEGSNPLEDVTRKYEEILQDKYSNLAVLRDYVAKIEDVLQPEEINRFLQTTIAYEQSRDYQKKTGIFISRLIQTSYDAGNNNFTLNIQNTKELASLGFNLEGTPENKIKLAIQGNVGNDFGEYSGNCEYELLGNAKDFFGRVSRKCTYKIRGNIGWGAGHESKICEYTILGDTLFVCGLESTDCTYTITGTVGSSAGFDSKNSTFKTNNPKTLEYLLSDLVSVNQDGQPSHNKLVFIHPDGREELMVQI